MYACTHIHVYVYIYIYIHMYICIWINVDAQMQKHTYVYAYMYVELSNACFHYIYDTYISVHLCPFHGRYCLLQCRVAGIFWGSEFQISHRRTSVVLIVQAGSVCVSMRSMQPSLHRAQTHKHTRTHTHTHTHKHVQTHANTNLNSCGQVSRMHPISSRSNVCSIHPPFSKSDISTVENQLRAFQSLATRMEFMQWTHCYATRCNTLQHTCNILQHTATHCSTLQHTAAHCNTL